MERPDISVCIPYYKGAAMIERCVASAAMQVLPPGVSVEIVLSVDAYDPADEPTLERVAERYRVEVHRSSTHLGMTRNWGQALKLGRGQIVTLLHQDDWYHPECLSHVWEAFSSSAVGFVSPHSVSFLDAGTSVVARKRSVAGQLDAADFTRLLLTFKQVPAPSQVFFRADALTALDPIYGDEYGYCPEFDLYLRFAAARPDMVFTFLGQRLVNRTGGSVQHGRSILHHRLLDYARVFMHYVRDDPDRFAAALEGRAHAQILLGLGTLFDALDPVDPDKFAATCTGLDTVGRSDLFWSFVDSHEAIAKRFVRQIRGLAKSLPDAPVAEVLARWRRQGWGHGEILETAIKRHRSVFRRRAASESPPRKSPVKRLVSRFGSSAAARRSDGNEGHAWMDRSYSNKKLVREPLLIAGFHHSGTRLVAQLLDRCGVYQPVAEDSPTHESRYFQLLDSFLLPRWHDPAAVRDFEADGAPDVIDPGTITRRLWAHGYDGDTSWGFKDPRLGPVLEPWLRTYPDAAVVHVVRDPLDVIGTLGPGYSRFSPSGSVPQHDAEYWCDLWEAVFERTRRAVTGTKRSVELRFEDIVRDPEGSLDRLRSDLDLDLRVASNSEIDIRRDAIGAHARWVEDGSVDQEVVSLIGNRLREWRELLDYS